MSEEEQDLMVGMMESMRMVISALIADHPDRDGLEAHIDFRIEPVRTRLLNSGLSDSALRAFDSTTQGFKELVANPFTGWSHNKEADAIMKRLSGK